MVRRVWSGFGLDGVDGTSIWHLFTSYLANRRPDCSRLFCAGKPSFIPFSGPPELAKRSRIGCASPTSAWYDQNGHISSVLGEILVVPFALWVFLKPRSMRFWEALIRVKRTSGSCVTAPSLQQPLTCDLFMSYLANRHPDCAHPFCVGKPSFTPFCGLPEIAKRSPIGGASPSPAWYDQDEHVSSVLGEIFVVPFVLWFVLKPWSMRFWEALIRVKRTSGSHVTAPSFQQPFTCDLFMSYLAVRRTDRSHPFCAGKPSFTPFFGLPELAKRPRIGCASPSSAWYDQDEHVLSVLSEIFVATFVLWFVLKLRSMRFWEALIRIKRTSGSCITASSLQQPFPHSYCHKLLASDVLWPVLNVGFVPFRRTYLRR